MTSSEKSPGQTDANPGTWRYEITRPLSPRLLFFRAINSKFQVFQWRYKERSLDLKFFDMFHVFSETALIFGFAFVRPDPLTYDVISFEFVVL